MSRADDPGKSGAWLKTNPRVRAKLAVLSLEAYVVLNKVWLYCQDVGNGGRFHVDELPAAVDRILTPAKLNRALAELHRVTWERSNGDGTVRLEPLWLDLVDDHVQLPDWWIEDNPPPRIYHDDTLWWRHQRNKRLHAVGCKELKAKIKLRDRNLCRYCGVRVNWEARNTDDAGTYDHVDPDEDNTLSNVVVACRRCNGRKRDRTPDQWITDDPDEGLALLRPGTTADQAAAQRAGPAPPQGSTQVRPESNSAPRPRARPSRVEPGSNPPRPATGSASPRPDGRPTSNHDHRRTGRTP